MTRFVLWSRARMAHLRLYAALTAMAIAGTAPAARLDAQEQKGQSVGSVPSDVAREATALFNASATRRVRGDFALASADTVRGDVVVLNGNARIAGVITGQLMVLNGDVTVQPGGRIEGTLTVLGGALESPERNAVLGDIRVWSARLRYHEEADTLVADVDRELFPKWSRWQRDDPNGSKSQFFLAAAHTYNRVEGLPIFLGPRLRVRNGDTRVLLELFGIFRTGDGLAWRPENLGHRVQLELRQGGEAGFMVGGRLSDEVDAIERWQLKDFEVGLNTFVATRDYRDYWQRHGGSGYLGVFGPAGTELRAGYGEERWKSRNDRDALSLFNNGIAWRANPLTDDGVLRLLTLSAKLDTRNRKDNPRSGWLVAAEFERGEGTLDAIAPTTPDVRMQVAGDVAYSRVFVDVRRYNRLAPGAQLNLRAVAGGWTGGDPLPMQRRFAVSSLDALPGFDFRRMTGPTDVGTCATGDDLSYEAIGRPAQCERMILLQAEWKGDFRINPFGDDDQGDRRWMAGRVRADGAWVLFANAGRGWLLGSTDNDLFYSTGSIPSFGSWRSDIGAGLDFGSFGVYFAKAVSESGLPVNVYMRLTRRF